MTHVWVLVVMFGTGYFDLTAYTTEAKCLEIRQYVAANFQAIASCEKVSLR